MPVTTRRKRPRTGTPPTQEEMAMLEFPQSSPENSRRMNTTRTRKSNRLATKEAQHGSQQSSKTGKTTTAQESIPARKRGRPRKNRVSFEAVRKTGRPRRNESQSEATDNESSQSGTGASRSTKLNIREQTRNARDRRKKALTNPILEIDAANNWLEVCVVAEELPRAKSFSSSGFRSLETIIRKTKRSILESTSQEELRENLASPSSLSSLCSQLSSPEIVDEEAAKDFVGPGLAALIDVLSTLFKYHSSVLLDAEEIPVLSMVLDFLQTIIAVAVKVHHIVAPGKATNYQHTLTAPAATIIGRLRLIAKDFKASLSARVQADNLRQFEADYEQAQQQIAIRTSRDAENRRRQLEERRTLVLPPPIDSHGPLQAAADELVHAPDDLANAAAKSPMHPRPGNSHLSQRNSSSIEWTEPMDEELVQSLYLQRNVPLPGRYRRCLLTPSLQNLLEDHIRSRALICRPSLIAWYEERGEIAPEWVTSIA